jgi:hypothetical protein
LQQGRNRLILDFYRSCGNNIEHSGTRDTFSL